MDSRKLYPSRDRFILSVNRERCQRTYCSGCRETLGNLLVAALNDYFEHLQMTLHPYEHLSMVDRLLIEIE